MPPRSKIAKLPDDMRAWLHRALVERAFGDIVPLTEELNAKLREANIAIYVGKSAVGAESQRVQRAQQSLRSTMEATRLIAETASNDGDQLGAATMAMIQSQIFDITLQVREIADLEDPSDKIAMLNKISLAAARLSRASVSRDKWQHELDLAVQAAADKAGRLAKDGGLSQASVQEIRRSILGIASAQKARDSAAQPAGPSTDAAT